MMTFDYTPKIPKTDLVHGAYYIGTCRNANLARWDGKREVFMHWRWNFNQRFIEEIRCPEDEARWDVFIAEYEVEEPTNTDNQIPLIELDII
jgi:hypothetical protein